MRYDHLNLSAFSEVSFVPSFNHCWIWKYLISSVVSHLPERAGVSGMMKKQAAPIRTVTMPSSKKIHAQPGRPPIPSIFAIPNARRPENAPERAEAQ